MRGKNWHMAIFILIHFSVYCCDFLISWCRHPPSNLCHPPTWWALNFWLLWSWSQSSQFHILRGFLIYLLFLDPGRRMADVPQQPCATGLVREHLWIKEAERRGMEKSQWAESWEKLQEEMAKSVLVALGSPGLGRERAKPWGNVTLNHPGSPGCCPE